MLNIVVTSERYLPCELNVFTINDIEANKCDFGFNEDVSPEIASEYGCGYNKFIPNTKASDIIKACNKYNLTPEEYDKVIEKLEEVLNVGSCGLCE